MASNEYDHASERAPGERRRVSDTSIPSYTQSVTRSSTISPISRGFSRLSLSRNRPADVVDDTWGAHGLRLLYAPPDPLIDVIFVHGLRGGSTKTWCKGEDLRLFWPKAWLPREPDLQNVRIHTFGYNADWASTKETSLDIHDFGRALFGEMTTSPHLRHDKDTPIVLVGHSMGGLVVKKAFLLAQQDTRSRGLAQRIQCMFFLATPHRGSDSAKTLNNILRASTFLHGRDYINDISRNSTSLQVISDEFRAFSDQVQIWSFYETQKTKVGPSTSVVVVDRDSAVLGYRNESVQPLNADHRDICKFESPLDPNYLAVKNSLSTAVETILGDVFARKSDETKALLGALETYLHIQHSVEDDLTNSEDMKATNSCHWITNLEAFQKWRDGSHEVGHVFWLTGVLGSGKSITSGHVITHLKSLGVDVSYYFFKHSRKEQRTVSSLLRSLAYQLCIIHPIVRQRLSLMEENHVTFDKDDERAIWRKIFVNEILKIPLPNQQFWVVDGLDDCQDAVKLLPLIAKADSVFTINLFFSSRKLPSLEKSFIPLKERLISHEMRIQDTLGDIRSYVRDHCDSLDMSMGNQDAFIDKMVNKANGSFLWTKLAFDELENVYSEDSIEEVLNEIPEGMNALYQRILDCMERNAREQNITKAILTWTVCGIRNLNIPELQAALKLDLNNNIPSMERTVEGLCGQIIRIQSTGAVQLVHSTARDYLLNRDRKSSLAIRATEAHGRLARVCLQYLCSAEFRPPKGRALVTRLKAVQSSFADYAATCWSEHVACASSSDDDLLKLVYVFLRSNVLTWIEFIARRRKNLYFLIRAARNLQNFLDRRAKYAPLLGPESSALAAWSTDLIRVTAKFGRNLLQDPSVIYFTIPPFCPSNSQIYIHARASAGLLSVHGFANTSWDDCICCIEHRDTRATSLAGADGMFAIGLKSGLVKLYHKMTCQERGLIHHGELVRVLSFDNASRHLVTSGNRSLKLWTVDGTLLWSQDHADPPVVVAFSQDDERLVVVTKSSTAICLSSTDGSPAPIDRHGYGVGSKRQLRQFTRQAILNCSISPDLKVLAMAYRGRPLQLWSVEEDVLLGACEKQALSISEVLFNPNPAIEILAVTYQDGELALFNVWSQQELASVAGEAYTMAVAPDGRTLATGDMLGTIKLWDYETLNLLYCIRSSDYEVKSLAFSGDGLRLYDIRDQKSKVWEPAVLVRKSISDDSSISDSLPGHEAPQTVGSGAEVIEITTMLAHPAAACIFVGKDDGAVMVHDADTGIAISKLYSHRYDALPTYMSWNQRSGLLATADASSTIQVWQVSQSAKQRATWEAHHEILKARSDGVIRYLAISPSATRLLVHGHESVALHQLGSGPFPSLKLPRPGDSESQDEPHYRWLALESPAEESLLSFARTDHIHECRRSTDGVWAWQDMRIDLDDSEGKPLASRITGVYLDPDERFVAVELAPGSLGDRTWPKLAVYPTDMLRGGRNPCGGQATSFGRRRMQPVAWLSCVQVKMFLGYYKQRFVFLDEDLWVRSISLEARRGDGRATAATSYLESTKHFIVPYEFIGGNQGVRGVVTASGNVLFPRAGEIGVIRDGVR